MTEEEINKKAEKHCNEVLCNAHEKCNEVIKCRDWRSRRAGFFCGYEQALKDFEKENAELRKVAEFQQSSNMNRYLENKKLKEGLAVGSTFNKALNSINKNLEEERDKYRNMVFDKDEQLTKAKVALRNIIDYLGQVCSDYPDCVIEAELFLKDCEVEK